MNIDKNLSRRVYRDADLAVINNTAFIQPYDSCHRGYMKCALLSFIA